MVLVHVQSLVQNPSLAWKDLGDLRNADYWNRTWIIQEVCLAQVRCYIIHGTGAVAFSALMEAHNKLWLITQVGARASENSAFLHEILHSPARKVKMAAGLHSWYDVGASVLFRDSIAETGYTLFRRERWGLRKFSTSNAHSLVESPPLLYDIPPSISLYQLSSNLIICSMEDIATV